MSAPLTEIDALRAALRASEERRVMAENEAATLRRESSEVSAAIGTVEFMDPPDGGSVSLGEQVSRMRAALQSAEERVRELEPALDGDSAWLVSPRDALQWAIEQAGESHLYATEAALRSLLAAPRAVSPSSETAQQGGGSPPSAAGGTR